MKVNTNGDELVAVGGKLFPKWQEPIRIAQAMIQAKAQEASDKAQADKAREDHEQSQRVATFLISLGLPEGEQDGHGRTLGQFKFWVGYHKHDNLYIGIHTTDEQDKLLRDYDMFEGLIDRTMIKTVDNVVEADNPMGAIIKVKGYAPYGSLVELQAWIADTMDRLENTLRDNLRSAASYRKDTPTPVRDTGAETGRLGLLFMSMIRQVIYEMRDGGEL